MLTDWRALPMGTYFYLNGRDESARHHVCVRTPEGFRIMGSMASNDARARDEAMMIAALLEQHRRSGLS